MNILNQPKLILTKNYIMKKTLLTLAAIAVVAVACDDDDTYVIPTPVNRVVVGFNGDTTVNAISLSSVATDMPTVTAVAFPDDATNKEIYWISSEPGVIEIDSKTGVMTRTDSVLTQMSTVVITARAVNALDGTATITLGKGEFVEGVTLSQYVDVPTDGSDLQTLTATVSPATVLDKAVTWSSSNPDLVAIDANTGRLTLGTDAAAVTAPTTLTITATANNGVKGTTTVIVGADNINSYWFEGETGIINAAVTKGRFWNQPWGPGMWSGDMQFCWPMEAPLTAADMPGAVLTAEFISWFKEGDFTLDAIMTKAGDFGVYKIEINGRVVVDRVDFNGVLGGYPYTWDAHLVRGTNTLKVTCLAASAAGVPTVFGIDKFTFTKK